MRTSLVTGWLLAGALVLGIRTPAAGGPQSGEGRVLRAGRLLTNDSIVRLVKAGVDDDTILHMVDTQPGKYSLGVDDVLRLKQAGVSDDVLESMLSHSAHGNPAPGANLPVQVFVTPPAASNSPGQLPVLPPNKPPKGPGGPPNQPPTPTPLPKPTHQAAASGSVKPQSAYPYGAGVSGRKAPSPPHP